LVPRWALPERLPRIVLRCFTLLGSIAIILKGC
jgi:hypothetical protein